MHLKSMTIEHSRFPAIECYPFDVALIQNTQKLEFTSPVAMFVGENGTGKTTLLDAITRKCGITVWDKPRRHLAHSNPFETKLADYVSVQWTNGSVPGSLFRAETFREFADFLDDIALCDPGRLKYHGGHILNTLSHGEAILSYFRGRYHIKGLYFLDEPEAALSPSSQLQFLKILQQLEEGGHAQFIIATHSPILLSFPGAQVFSFDAPVVEEVPYESTAHYQLYYQFFTDRSSLMETAVPQGSQQGGRLSASL